MRLRVATAADVEPMLALKSKLQLARADARTGGFLLGSSAEQYRFFVDHAQVLVLDRGLDTEPSLVHAADCTGEQTSDHARDQARNHAGDHARDRAGEQSTRAPALIGFVIALGDRVLRQSDLWNRRHAIQWQSSPLTPPPLENLRLSYIEQLAVLPELAYRPYAPALALAIAQRLFADHDYILTTTVHQPIRNLAAWPLLAIADAQLMGFIDEEYPHVGRIQSALHGVERSRFIWQLRHSPHQPLLRRIQKTVDRLQQCYTR
ncbi:MAG TPA: hypothetical protein V6C88_01675 [Chroococcidiopsis sp.]